MAEKDGPRKFTRPGDNPELDALLAELRRDGAGGDPLFPADFRRGRAGGGRPASPQGAPEPKRDHRPGRAPTATPAPAAAASASGSQESPAARQRVLWVALAALAIGASVVALGLAVLLESLRDPEEVIAPAPGNAQAGTGPVASAAADAMRDVESDAGVMDAAEDAGMQDEALDAGASRGIEPARTKQPRKPPPRATSGAGTPAPVTAAPTVQPPPTPPSPPDLPKVID